MNRPNDDANPSITPPPSAPAVRRGLSFKLAALGLTLSSILAGTAAYLLKSPADKPEGAGKGIPAYLFHGWSKPDFVIVLSAQQQGYLLPCGCSKPQVGGLERRYNFIQLLKARGWPVVAVDLGDIPQKSGPANLQNIQGLIKYRYSMMALKAMDYLAAGIGEHETAGSWSLASIEGEWAASFAQPAVLAANLLDAPNKFPFLKAQETQTVPGANIKVGVTSIIGPTVAEKVQDRNVKFGRSDASLREQLKRMGEQNVDLPILLYHGVATDKRQEAVRCAEAFPQFPVILAVSEEDEPPDHPLSVNRGANGTTNYVFRLGHKGKYIGVIGVYRNGRNFNFNYQLVKMTTDYETPPEQQDANPIMKLMEDYTRELKTNDYLAKYGQSNHTLQFMNPVPGLRNPGDNVPKYIGTEACKKCHDYAYDVWKASGHSHAYQTLVDAKHPSLRQYDGECIVCHTVGFGYKTGYYENGKDTPKLKNVGCESCHGPGSLHAKNPENQEWRDRMNQPWRAARKKGDEAAKNRAIEKFCITCHDMDNDVNWVHDGKKNPFHEKWIKGKIIHNQPKEKE